MGRGAMARVYRARQTRVDRHVAVKLLHPELMGDPTAPLRLQREARAAGRIRHPNVVEVLFAGELGPGDPGTPGQPFLVLEFLQGTTLGAALAAETGGLGLGRAVHIALQIADALGEAHALGIVHRDLKPDNVVLVRRGHDPDFVKLLDFGLSRLDGGEADFATREGAVLGTARYLSPEAARGEPVGPQGDVYTIATLFFECLTGRTPFEADSPVALLVRRTHETAADVRSFPNARDVPPPLAELLARSLSRDPRARPADAREFGRLLVEAARAGGVDAQRPLARSTLLGTRSAATPSTAGIGAQATRPLGSPATEPALPPPWTATDPDTPLTRATQEVPERRRLLGLRRIGVVVACFALGVIGALLIAFHGGGP